MYVNVSTQREVVTQALDVTVRHAICELSGGSCYLSSPGRKRTNPGSARIRHAVKHGCAPNGRTTHPRTLRTVGFLLALMFVMLAVPTEASIRRDWWTERRAADYLMIYYTNVFDASCTGTSERVKRSKGGRKLYSRFGCRVTYTDGSLGTAGVAPLRPRYAYVKFFS